MARVVSGIGLTGGAGGSGSWVAELIYGCDIGAIEKVEGVGDQFEAEAFAEWNALGHAHVPFKKSGSGEAIAAEIAVATGRRADARDAKSSEGTG